jgi:hypothetical protein
MFGFTGAMGTSLANTPLPDPWFIKYVAMATSGDSFTNHLVVPSLLKGIVWLPPRPKNTRLDKRGVVRNRIM